MKLLILVVIFGIASAEKLDNTYLPPLSARTAGGSGSFLSTPFQGGRPFGSSALKSFPPSGIGASSITSQGLRGFPNAPAPEYGVPTAYRGGIQPSYYPKSVQILRYNNDNTGDGTYRFEYETENKIFQQEHGQLKNAGTGQESSVVHGSYSYDAPDGQKISVNYVADENGFQASGDHLPVAPPIPEAIQKSLQVNAASGYPSSYDAGNGQYYAGPGGQYQTPLTSQYQSTPSGRYQPAPSGQYQSASSGQYQSAPGGQYQSVPSGQYQSGQLSRQYLTPNTGYRY